MMNRSPALRLGGAFVALSLGLGLVVQAGATAHAEAAPVGAGSLDWGYRASFRSYVGQQTAALPPIGKLPEGQRITVKDGATFDTAGTPANPAATSTPNESLPYKFAVSGGTFTDSTHLSIDTSGGVVYHFPSHAFEASVANVSVVVDGSTAQLVGDLSVKIAANDLGYPEGNHGGTDVVIANIGAVNVTQPADKSSVTITGSSLTATAAAADAMQGFLAEGNAMDDFSLTVALPAQNVAVPTVSVSQNKVPGDAATTITVTGAGFDPALATGTRPPLAGKPAGAYVVFGYFANDWRPSAGAASSSRPSASMAWAVMAEDVTTVGGPSRGGIVLNPDGSFTTQLVIDKSVADAAATKNGLTAGSYGIYTYAGAGAVTPAYETFTPIQFTSDGDQDIDVTIPTTTDPGPDPEPGVLTMTIDNSGGAVSMGTATASSASFASTGSLNPVVIKDTREGGQAWSTSGSVSAFTSTGGSFSGKYLGWTPRVAVDGAGAVAGLAVAPGLSSGNGLTQSSTLASGAAGHTLGTATLGADLSLQVPLDTKPGAYSAVLTLTTLG